MKRYQLVSYNCIAYDECTNAEREWIANCGKPTGVYSGPNNASADATEDLAYKDIGTQELIQTRARLLEASATDNGCWSKEDIDGMIAAINRELSRRKDASRIVP